MLNSVAEAGLIIDYLLEPLPTEEFKAADSREYAKLCERPGFLCIRAKRAANET
jgi:hypothetical protein